MGRSTAKIIDFVEKKVRVLQLRLGVRIGLESERSIEAVCLCEDCIPADRDGAPIADPVFNPSRTILQSIELTPGCFPDQCRRASGDIVKAIIHRGSHLERLRCCPQGERVVGSCSQ